MDKFEKIMNIVEKLSQEVDNDNANISSNSPTAKNFRISEEISKFYYLEKLIPQEFSEAHRKGYIHIHDLGFYNKTYNCFHIPLKKLLKKGFNTGHIHIREPKRPASVMALVAILIQSVQNSQYGGVSIPKFDTDLEEFMIGFSEREIYQAIEALIFNLNTLHSRSAAQTPFSSLNLGLNTSPVGRLIIKNTLLAYEAGGGKGENFIFPNIIFKLKKGINYYPTDPNYDLYQLALRVASKRMNPTFLFIDAPFNIKYGNEMATMGAVLGESVISYKYKGNYYCEGIKRLWERVNSPVIDDGVNIYKRPPLGDVQIYDMENGFVDVRTVLAINDPSATWKRLTFSNGRTITVTSDHPLYTENKGRIRTDELELGDTIKTINTLPNIESDNSLSKEEAYLLGLILCDGCYANGQVNIALDGRTENDVIKEVQRINSETYVKHWERGSKGTYDTVHFRNSSKMCKELKELFGGTKKNDRKIPEIIFNSSREVKLNFLAGMIDADGGTGSRGYIQIGSTNKELSLQQAALLQSLNIPVKIYINHYTKDKIRYLVCTGPTDEIVSYLKCDKKKKYYNKRPNLQISDVVSLVKIEDLGYLDEILYDVETSTDKFTVNFINSGNCRTRVITDRFGDAVTSGRGNITFTTINLPRLAIESEQSTDDFYRKLDTMMDLVSRQLVHRYKIVSNLKAKDIPFVMDQGLYIGSEKLTPEDRIEPAIKHGTLGIGFIGLAEALTSLVDCHHGETTFAQQLGLDIIEHLHLITKAYSDEYNLNFSLFATPAEGLCERFLNIDRNKFGIIPGVTDKDYYTNSFHIPVGFDIPFDKKIELEAPYHALTPGGHISYVELSAPPVNNTFAMDIIVKKMAEEGIGYGGINFPIDECQGCGYSGVITTPVCPNCGGTRIRSLRRVSGYLSTLENFNDGKKAEALSRKSHFHEGKIIKWEV